MTDLGQAYREAYQKNFVEYGSARILVVYSSVSSSVYDTATGEVTQTTTPRPGLYVLPDTPALEKIAGITIEENETGVTFPVFDLTDGSSLVDPVVGDFYTDPAGKSWRVTGVYSDNFKAQWLLKVKRYNRG